MTIPEQGIEVDHIEFPAGRIRYCRAGTSGAPIVLLHGAGLDNAMLSWRHAIPMLATDHRVYAPDLPKQGGSTPWLGLANQRTLEEVLRWLLDAWEVPAATLVGLSMGGSIATGFALRHPHRVRGLVLVDSGGFQHKLDKHALNYWLTRLGLFGSISAKVLGLHPSLIRRMLTKVAFADGSQVPDLTSLVEELREEAKRRTSALTDWQVDALGRRSCTVNHLPLVNRIHCSTMVVHGAQDKAVPVSVAREMADGISGSQLQVIDNAGHWPNREKPSEFNALLREFVNTHG